MASRIGRGLPEDVIPEVLGETWTLLLARPVGDFDPARGSAKAYLYGLMQNAAKAVRALYAAPGKPRRERSLAHPIASAQEAQTTAPQEVPELPLEEYTDAGRAASRLEAHLDVESILEAAPPAVARALLLIHGEGETLDEAARRQGLRRQQLGRELRTFSAEMQCEVSSP